MNGLGDGHSRVIGVDDVGEGKEDVAAGVSSRTHVHGFELSNRLRKQKRRVRMTGIAFNNR